MLLDLFEVIKYHIYCLTRYICQFLIECRFMQLEHYLK